MTHPVTSESNSDTKLRLHAIILQTNMSERIKPVFNHLDNLARGQKIMVVSSTQISDKPRMMEGEFVGTTPSTDGPLSMRLNHYGDFVEGAVLFAGLTEGIISIVDLDSETPIFHNGNIPIPWFEPGSIDIRRDIGPLEQRQVDMGLYPDLESLQKAKSSK